MEINFNKMDGLVPAVIQHHLSREILMLGYMNKQAYEQTVNTGRVTFYSRIRQQLWTKGETSGHYLDVVDICLDCDQDTLLIRASPNGPVCHMGTFSCFGEKKPHGFLYELEEIIQNRKRDASASSYTVQLFESGTAKIAQKVGEEAVEVVIEAMRQNEEQLVNEVADLLYHLLVLMNQCSIDLSKVEERLMDRHNVRIP